MWTRCWKYEAIERVSHTSCDFFDVVEDEVHELIVALECSGNCDLTRISISVALFHMHAPRSAFADAPCLAQAVFSLFSRKDRRQTHPLYHR